MRLIPLAVGAASLVTGLWSGLARLGLELPGGMPAVAEFHGALMVSGFLGTLISLERAVAIGRWWAYAAPAIAAVGAVLLIAGAPAVAAIAFLIAGLALAFNSIIVVARQFALFTVVLGVAALCWIGGTLTWIGGAAPAAVTGWWLAFLILTIAAERLELSRLRSPPRSSQLTFAVATLIIIIGAARGEYAADLAPFSGVGLLFATAWLVRHDIALRTIRFSGQARFSAACLLSGYVWLGVAGLLLLVAPPGTSAFTYDAAIHAITIGFVLSMIFGHAPIILPAVTGARIRYSAAAYAPLAVLHGSVLLRVAADLTGHVDIRALSGPVTILAFAGYAVTLLIVSRRK
ncbi:MAG: hypothetical protein EPO23_11250 [Xanthobacteraceae bacterium]|nr:MAG: hypothetical protein EPO23_11250 [Xanthobacteraceae bacterium]